MRRVLALVIAALAVSACSDTEPPALEVNGAEISQDEFRTALEALAAAGVGDGTAAMTPQEGGAGRGATTIADLLVDVALIEDELDERDIEPSEDDRRLAEEEIPDDAPDISDDARELLLEWGSERFALLRALFEEEVDPTSLLCLRVILAADEAEAEELQRELFAGADFARLAVERSRDPGTAELGGDLGCQSQTFRPELQEAAADLAIGDIGGPVTLEFGTVLIQRSEPTFDSTRGTIDDAVLDPMLQQLRGDADVDIDPRFGRWDGDAEPPQVVPPEGPVEATTTTVPAAPSPFEPPPIPPEATVPGNG